MTDWKILYRRLLYSGPEKGTVKIEHLSYHWKGQIKAHSFLPSSLVNFCPCNGNYPQEHHNSVRTLENYTIENSCTSPGSLSVPLPIVHHPHPMPLQWPCVAPIDILLKENCDVFTYMSPSLKCECVDFFSRLYLQHLTQRGS